MCIEACAENALICRVGGVLRGYGLTTGRAEAMLAAVTGTADHVRRNRAAWDRLAADYTSGHVPALDLRRLVEALGPKRVVAIHSDAGDRFCGSFPRAERHADGDWWQVGSK
jgi:hypothetical protein